jgi:hypothetical protein
MQTEHQVVKDIAAGVAKLLSGTMDKAEFDKFLVESNKRLAELAKKKRDDEDWFRYSTTFC